MDASENPSIVNTSPKPIAPHKIYFSTFNFVLLKLSMRVVCTILSCGLLAGAFAISRGKNTIQVVAIFGLWGLITLQIIPVINRFGGYLIHAGHVAAVMKTVKKNHSLATPVRFGMKLVKRKFPTTAAYFVANRLIKEAIVQINRILCRTISSLIPAATGILSDLVGSYVTIAIGSSVDCCLAYTYMKKKKPLKAARDGVVIYVRNWKPVLKDAAAALTWSKLITILFVLVPAVACIVVLYNSKELSWWVIPALFLAGYVATGVKSAIIDSYVMVRMVSGYCRRVAVTPICDQDYRDLNKISKKFRCISEAVRVEEFDDREIKKKRKK